MKLFIMKRILLVFILVAAAASARAQDSLSVSLLTCSQGDDIASAFGHSALRVKDLRHGRDMVFNYGTFSFNEPHFMLKFLRGELNYCLSVNSFENFKVSYDKAGRGITEQDMNLTPAQASEIYAFLLQNYQPANRFYLYDFLQDNCATRIRDIFETTPGFSFDDTLSDLTYREELTRLVGDRRWMMFGIDLILGAKVDRRITVRESEFLPDRLSPILASYRNDTLDCRLMTSSTVLSEPAPRPGKAARILSKATSPFSIFTVLFVLYLVLYLRSRNKWKFMSICSTVLYIVLGLGGVIICLMWFATEHVWTANNWNLMWMNPIFLIPVFMPDSWAKNLIIDILAAVSALCLIFSWILPQTLHPAAAVIILLTVLMALSRRAIYRKY